MPRRHPPEKKAAYLVDVPEMGISGAAKAHGIDKATGSRWARDAGIATVATERTRNATEGARLRWEERRASLVHDLGDLAAESLEQIRANLTTKPRISADLARVLSIAVDKAQLLSGGATSRAIVDRQASLEALDELAERRKRAS